MKRQFDSGAPQTTGWKLIAGRWRWGRLPREPGKRWKGGEVLEPHQVAAAAISCDVSTAGAVPTEEDLRKFIDVWQLGLPELQRLGNIPPAAQRMVLRDFWPKDQSRDCTAVFWRFVRISLKQCKIASGEQSRSLQAGPSSTTGQRWSSGLGRAAVPEAAYATDAPGSAGHPVAAWAPDEGTMTTAFERTFGRDEAVHCCACPQTHGLAICHGSVAGARIPRRECGHPFCAECSAWNSKYRMLLCPCGHLDPAS
jgi:hypothetical protein